MSAPTISEFKNLLARVDVGDPGALQELAGAALALLADAALPEVVEEDPETKVNEARARVGLPPLKAETVAWMKEIRARGAKPEGRLAEAAVRGDQEIVLKESRGFLWWRREVSTTYRGSGTVWHEVSTGRRADTRTEARLADIAWRRLQEAAC